MAVIFGSLPQLVDPRTTGGGGRKREQKKKKNSENGAQQTYLKHANDVIVCYYGRNSSELACLVPVLWWFICISTAAISPELTGVY